MAEEEKIEELNEENISLEASDDVSSDIVSEEIETETDIKEESSAIEEEVEVEKKVKKKFGTQIKNILKRILNILISMLMGRILPVDFILKHWKPILTIMALGIFYTSNRYICQQSAAHIKRVESEIVEIRYKSLGMFARLKTLQREDSIATLIDRAGLELVSPKYPPYTIKATKKDGE